MSQAPIRYEMRLGVVILNTVIMVHSKDDITWFCLTMLVDEDAVIVTEEDQK